VMLPKSVLNSARREVLAILADKMTETYQRAAEYSLEMPRLKRFKAGTPFLLAVVDDLKAAQKAEEAGIRIVYLDRTAKKAIDWDEAAALAQRIKVYALLPETVNHSQYKVMEKEIANYEKAGFCGIVCANPWALKLAKDCGYSGEIIGDGSLNAFNSYAIDFWRQQGVGRLQLSTELNLQQIRDLQTSLPLEVQVFGSQQMMISEHCVLGAAMGGKTAASKCDRPCERYEHFELKDEKGYRFPVIGDRFCRMHLYNGHILCLFEDWDKLFAAGVVGLRLDFRALPTDIVAKVAAQYKLALASYLEHFDFDAEAAREKLSLLCGRKLTKGHYYRGVE
jgi:putative protease